QLVGCVKLAFRWAVAEEMVSPVVSHGLQAVAALEAGRTTAGETEPVVPADDAAVEATVPYLSRQVATMVRLQRLTGMRSGEVVIMRGADVQRDGPVWLYRPVTHKGEHHGKQRVVPLGPNAQAVLAPFLLAEPEGYLFCPRQAERERH